MTSSCSNGGNNPVILSVNRESRAEALRHLTLKFKTYWNLEIDFLYIDVRLHWPSDSLHQLKNMRREGLLNDIKNLAFDSVIWESSGYSNQW